MPQPASVPRPLGIRPDLKLSVEQQEMLQAIAAYDLWFVEERLERKGLVNRDQIPEATLAFRRYMALVGLGYRGLGMTSPTVDEVWHAFILFTREYAAFCEKVFGEFIHHVPRTSKSPAGDPGRTTFADAYREVFDSDAPDLLAPVPAASAAGDEPSGCGTEDCTSN